MPRSVALIGALLVMLIVLLGARGSYHEPAQQLRAAAEAPSQVSSSAPADSDSPSLLDCTDARPIPDYYQPLAFVDPLHGWMRGQVCADGAWRDMLTATTDGGQTWQVIGSLGMPGVLRFISREDGWLLGEHVLVTRDGGASWAEDSALQDVHSLEAIGSDVWAIQGSCEAIGSCDYRLLMSSDAGRTWHSAPAEPPAVRYGARLARAGLQDAWLLSGGGERPRALFATHDGGTTWQELTIPCTGFGSHLVAVDAAHVWFLCSGLGGAGSEPKWLYASSDGGEEWQLVAETAWPGFMGIANLPLSGYAHHLAVVSPERAFIGLGRGSLLMTIDGGQSWTYPWIERETDVGITGIVFVDEEHGWAATRAAIWRTTDGGDTWERLAP
jgi:photosystem II stability/assembly factor-like uncharacterized protein